MEVMHLTSFESMSLLMQLATVMIAGFSIVVSLLIFFMNKK